MSVLVAPIKDSTEKQGAVVSEPGVLSRDRYEPSNGNLNSSTRVNRITDAHIEKPDDYAQQSSFPCHRLRGDVGGAMEDFSAASGSGFRALVDYLVIKPNPRPRRGWGNSRQFLISARDTLSANDGGFNRSLQHRS